MAYDLPRVPLRNFVETDRFRYLDRLEQYLHNAQDEHKRYDWEGNFSSAYGGTVEVAAPVRAGYVVALSARRPCAPYRLPRIIVANLTQMALGGPAFAELNVEGDEAAEQAVREWAKLMKLPSRIAEGRRFGGAEGTAVYSLGVVRGRFRLEVHNPKLVTVLDWLDAEEFLPARVLKAYSFERQDVDSEAGKLVTNTYWHVRYWDSERELLWRALPDVLAAEPDWSEVPPDFEAVHGFGFCPVYWVQNLPDSQELDGEGDYEGSEPKIDELNRLYSATTRGAIKNVDPTLVLKKEDDDEPVQKGSGAVIFSPNGAEYLELQGTAIAAAKELGDELRQSILEEAQVVIPREDKITGAAQSAAAMRILYRPMIARCNTLRDQYGEAIARIMDDVLRIARGIRARPAYDVLAPDGVTVLEQRRDVVVPDLDPGDDGSAVTLRWPPYFEPTSQDVKDTVTTAQTASGGKSVISQRTAVDAVARLYGVEDVDQELAAIEDDAETEAERMGDQLEREAKVFADAKTGAEAAAEERAAE